VKRWEAVRAQVRRHKVEWEAVKDSFDRYYQSLFPEPEYSEIRRRMADLQPEH